MRKEHTSVELVDDIDGSTATTTIEFTVNDKNYIIDLSEENAAAFNAVLAPYIEHARRARATKKNKNATRKSRSSSEAARAKRQRNTEIRTWALENGVNVSKRGQLGQSTIAAYEAAHTTEQNS